MSCKTLGSSIVNLGRECKQLVSLENNLKWNFGRYECGHIFCTKHGIATEWELTNFCTAI